MGEWWTEGEWKGIKNYKCEHCSFSTPDYESILQHIQQHKPPKPSKTVQIPVVDRFGNQITEKGEG